jgi:hypothetical protein
MASDETMFKILDDPDHADEILLRSYSAKIKKLAERVEDLEDRLAIVEGFQAPVRDIVGKIINYGSSAIALAAIAWFGLDK